MFKKVITVSILSFILILQNSIIYEANVNNLIEFKKEGTYYGMNNTVEKYDLALEIREVLRGKRALDKIKKASDNYEKIEENEEYILVKFRATGLNTIANKKIILSNNDFAIYSDGGTKYTTVKTPDIEPKFTPLITKSRTEGYVAFRVKKYEDNLAIVFRENTANALWLATEKEQIFNKDRIRPSMIDLIATNLGQIYGIKISEQDYLFNKKANGNNALRDFESEIPIAERFSIYYLNDTNYVEFAALFRKAFLENYRLRYSELFLNEKIEEVNVIPLGLNEIKHSFSPKSTYFSESMKTELINENILHFYAKENTFYEDGILEIKKLSSNNIYNSYNLTSVTSPYIFEVKTRTNKKSIKNNKELEISFKNVDNDKAGIYKYIGNDWIYQKTEFIENRLVHKIKVGDFDGGVYRLLIDDNYTTDSRIYLDWAFEELGVYFRRGYLDKLSNIGSNKLITRKELAKLIYENTYNNYPYIGNKKVFKDENEFGEYKNSIYYVYNRGIMLGVSSEKFNPNGYVTYKEFEIVISRTIGKPFDFKTIHTSMLYNKFKKSNLDVKKENKISTSEVVYGMYQIFE